MNLNYLFLIILCISVTSGRLIAAAPATGQGQPNPGHDFAVIERAVRQALPSTTIDAIAPAPIPGLVEIVAGRNILYADTSGRWLLVGHLYDLKNARDVTEDRKARLTRLNWDDLPLAAAVHFGTGPLRFAIFSDPDCPWCRKLRTALHQAEDFEVWEIMFPITALHPKAYDKAAAILCHTPHEVAIAHANTVTEPGSATPAAEANKGSSTMDGRSPAAECLRKARQGIDQALAFGHAHGIQGTPTLVAPDGRVHPGYLPLDRLRAWLTQETGTNREATE